MNKPRLAWAITGHYIEEYPDFLRTLNDADLIPATLIKGIGMSLCQ
ncbi:MAG: hypothetical protein PHG00_05900 [Methylococcales bacterium]|nr:hypothetical protein [Methylococcales bacterium]